MPVNTKAASVGASQPGMPTNSRNRMAGSVMLVGVFMWKMTVRALLSQVKPKAIRKKKIRLRASKAFAL
jgi:hypothetical protein